MDGSAHGHMHTYKGRRTALMVFLTGLELAKVANPRYLPIPSSPALQLQMGTTIFGLNSGLKASMKGLYQLRHITSPKEYICFYHQLKYTEEMNV